ncbi:MAG: helix-turn-helix transcriptional regulator [Henriciella sp.]|nr:helix-turn-helix transcriptional regulator [Henriciella sp.]
MQHGDIWRGIDLLARKHGLTPSGLARRAGLDATAFNKSKRLPKDGRPRWPSTESLARVLAAVGSDFDEFAALVSGRRSVSLPLVAEEALNHTDAAQHLENADVTSKHIRLPSNGASDTCFIVELTSDAFAPAYQIGDRLIVALDVQVRAGDRVLAKASGEAVVIGALEVRPGSGGQLTLRPMTDHAIEPIDVAHLEWTARILWASQ